MVRTTARLLVFSALAALFFAATTSSPADTGVLKFLPAESEIVVLIDFAALPNDPQLQGIVSMLDMQLQSEMAGQDAPKFSDMQSAAFGVVIPDTEAAEPIIYAVAKTNKTFDSVEAAMAADGVTPTDHGGRQIYETPDVAITLSPTKDLVLIASTVADIDKMVAAFDGMNAASRPEVMPSSGSAASFLYVHVNGPESIHPQVATAKMQAQGFGMMMMAQVPPPMQASVQSLIATVPSIFEAAGWDVRLGFSETEFIADMKGKMANAEAAGALASGVEGVKKAAIEMDPAQAANAGRGSASASGDEVTIGMKMPKDEAIMVMQQAIGMAMMQAAGAH